MRRCSVPAVLSALLLTSAAAHATSTYLDEDYGYSKWITPGPAGTTYDASNARWDFRNSDADDPVKSTEGCSGSNINRYPVGVRNYDDLVLLRPLIEGHISLTAVWGHLYDGGQCNAASVFMRDGKNMMLDGARITRTWDAVRPASRDDEFYTIRNTWISDARDDCIEADGSAPGLIEDSLIDGCFQGISMRPGSDIGDKSYNTLTVKRVLMRVKAHNHSEADGSDQRFSSGQIFKVSGTSARVEIHDSILAIDTPDMEGNHSQTAIMLGDAALGGRHGEDLKACSNNRVLWMHDDSPPEVLRELDPCFALVTGATARAEWESARCEWIQNHPSSVTRRAAEDAGVCEGVSGTTPPKAPVIDTGE